jgi:hypothetical protein
MRLRQAAMRDLVDYRFDCSDFARSHSMTDVEGGLQTFAGSCSNGSGGRATMNAPHVPQTF